MRQRTFGHPFCLRCDYHRVEWLRWVVVFVVLGACGSSKPDPPLKGTSGDTTDASTSSDDDGATGQSNPEATTSTTGSADASTGVVTTTGSADTSDASTGVMATTTTGSSSGGPYSFCESDEDCDPGLHCNSFPNYCSPDCELEGPCPEPSSGDPSPSCANTNEGPYCRLSCSPGVTTCPDGMYCYDVFPGPPPACIFE